MTEKEFSKLCKTIIADTVNECVRFQDEPQISEEDVSILLEYAIDAEEQKLILKSEVAEGANYICEKKEDTSILQEYGIDPEYKKAILRPAEMDDVYYVCTYTGSTKQLCVEEYNCVKRTIYKNP